MFDSLRNDPWIREHYQFWVYSYPSGYPYPYSAALFRQDLDGIERAFPNHKRVVLIGHSMGRNDLPINDHGRGRQNLARIFFAKSPAKTPLSSDTRKLLEESLVFNHRPGVQTGNIYFNAPSRQQNSVGLDRPDRRRPGQNSAAVHFSLHFDPNRF